MVLGANFWDEIVVFQPLPLYAKNTGRDRDCIIRRLHNQDNEDNDGGNTNVRNLHLPAKSNNCVRFARAFNIFCTFSSCRTIYDVKLHVL